ncbi:hypothetical protein SAMD00019534_091640, partial [Acytostelium subglobosum LB1]|uniref:hypothetical protein n=1 Tax=Acytostelium subglobosum LB1 TaxID=1410327 RepID=UPI000644E8FB
MWRVETCSNEPYPRCAHQCDVVGDYVYMFGGWTDENQMLNDLHRFNIDTWEWEEIRPQEQNQPIIARNGHTLTTYNKMLVLFGGGSFAGFLNDVATFDTETQRWIHQNTEGAIPSGRSKHSASIVGTYLYVFGGGDGVRLHNDLYCLDLGTMHWALVEAKGQAPSPRWGHTMVALDSKRLLIFGGHSGTRRLNDLHMFDIETNQWSQPQIMSEPAETPQPRAGHTASMIGPYMVVFGGGDGHILDDFVGLDTRTWRWWKIMPDTPGGRCAHSSSVIKDKLVIFGGGNGLHCIRKMVVFSNIDNIDSLYQQSRLKGGNHYIDNNNNSNDSNNNNNNNNNNNSGTPNKKVVTTPKKLVKADVNESLLSSTIESLAKKVQDINSRPANHNEPQQPPQPQQPQPQQQPQSHPQPKILATNIDKLQDSCLTDRERRDIKSFLTNIGMNKFINRFIEEEIDTTVLHMLNEDHLKQLGITLLGDRLAIIKGIRESSLYIFKGLPPLPIDIDPNFKMVDDKIDL